MVPLFGAEIKAPHFDTDLSLQKTVLNPPVNGKIQGIFTSLSIFQVLFKANLILKDFSRQSCIFKYFSSLYEPCLTFLFMIHQFHESCKLTSWLSCF